MGKGRLGTQKTVMVERRRIIYSRKKVQFVRLGAYIASLQQSLGLSPHQVCAASHVGHELYKQLLGGVAKNLDVYFRLMRFFMKKLVGEEFLKVFKRCCICCVADMFSNYNYTWEKVEKSVWV